MIQRSANLRVNNLNSLFRIIRMGFDSSIASASGD
eukprot:gene26206-34827_t